MAGARYFPHAPPLTAQTRCSTVNASAVNFLGRPDLVSTGRGVLACANRRLALSRDQPVTATTSSSSRDFTTLDAIRYARAYFAVISVRVATDKPSLMPSSVTAIRASTYEARPSLRGHYL